MSSVRIDVRERQARLAVRHHLAPDSRAGDIVTAVRAQLVLHATDPASVYLGAWARLQHPTVSAVEHALYQDRSLVRMLGMRRTMFVVPVELVPVVQAACTRTIAARERRRTERFLAEAGLTDDAPGWLAEVEEATLAALREREEALSTELSARVPRLAERLVVAAGKSYEAKVSVASRVLPLLAAHGRIVRGRPRGTWTSGQYRWSTIEAWLPGGVPHLDAEAARVQLAHEWLRAFGPAPVEDLVWWSGWSLGQTRAALRGLDLVEVDLDGAPGVVLADDLEPTVTPPPHAALLPGLDSTVMGWQSRGWFLGDYAKALFDTTGNAGPTVWWAGRVVGGWTQRDDGEVTLRLLEDVGRQAADQIAAEAARLQLWIGPVRVTPRFRTPLERELVG
jgi:hypothetical protein